MSRIEVYFNRHKKRYSVRTKGRVLYHASCILIRDPRFVVQEGGRQRVIREGRKNVHAFVVATTMEDLLLLPDVAETEQHLWHRIGWTHQVWYRPTLYDSFRCENILAGPHPEVGAPVRGAVNALMFLHHDIPQILIQEPLPPPPLS